MKKIITIELLNKVAQYLAQKPFLEVNQLIVELSNLPTLEEKEEKK